MKQRRRNRQNRCQWTRSLPRQHRRHCRKQKRWWSHHLHRHLRCRYKSHRPWPKRWGETESDSEDWGEAERVWVTVREVWFFLINTSRVWIISIPYPVKLYPWKTGYYPKHLDRVGLDIHYPMGMTIPNCNDYYMGIGISIIRNTLQVINCEKDIRKSQSTNPNKTH